jgi:hypothetical protein
MGFLVVLTNKTHHDFFIDLWESGEAEFELEPATRKSVAPRWSLAPTKAAWCGSKRPNFASTLENPFHGKADVRLTKVRVWLLGKENKLDHKVTLVQLGDEQFRRPDDTPYPKRLKPAEEKDQDKRTPEYIMHEPVQIPFSYNAKGLRYDGTTGTFTPGTLFGNTVGSEDGDLRFPKDGISNLPLAGEYAPVGPFGKWRLIVRKDDNPRLNLSDVSAIVIDFHGFHQSFDLNA